MAPIRNALLAGLLIVAAACTAPVPTSVPLPTASPSTSPQPSGLSGEFSHFESDYGLDFDYPVEWPLISDGGDETGVDETVVVIGTGT